MGFKSSPGDYKTKPDLRIVAVSVGPFDRCYPSWALLLGFHLKLQPYGSSGSFVLGHSAKKSGKIIL